MLRYALVLAAAALLPGCFTFIPDGDNNGGGNGSTTLDRTSAVIQIVQEAGSSSADVMMELRDSRGRLVTLNEDQSISVGGRELMQDGPGALSATINAGNSYEIVVREPTRGVERTTISGPASFAVIDPPSGGDISLSGFTLRWSNAGANRAIRVRITQDIFDEVRSETFSRDADAGELELDVADLSEFVQGADLVIEVTKIAETDSVNGLGSALVNIERSVRRTATPTP